MRTGMISREVALTEVWLDDQARLAGPSLGRVSTRTWAAEIAKAAVWLVGLVLAILLLALLAPTSRADTIDASTVAAYLTANTPLPLAVGIGGELAGNLLSAQDAAWGQVWQEGSLQASEDAVLRAIGLYVWPGGPSSITESCCEVVWDQSRVAIDLRLSVGTSTDGLQFGSQAVPEPATLVGLVVGLVGLVLIRWGTQRSMADRMRSRLAAYRAVQS